MYERLLTWWLKSHIKKGDKMDAKSFLKSKTLWVNAIAFIALIVQGFTGFVIDVELQATLLTVINVILRFVTNSSVSFK